MATLEELEQVTSGQSFDSKEGFIAKYGKTQDNVLKNFNTGVARFFGLPRTLVDLMETGENKLLSLVGIDIEKREGGLPTAEQIQQFGANQGMAFAPGEEPQDTTSRIIQNIGTAGPLLPFLGPAAFVPELLAATGGAIGGKIMEQTDFGQNHPVLARALGELGGGISPGVAKGLINFYAKGGIVGHAVRGGRKGIEEIKKGKELLPDPKVRATRRLDVAEATPDISLSNIDIEGKSQFGKTLTPGQSAGTKGVASLSRTVEAESAEYAAFIAKRRIRQRAVLEGKFKGTGSVEDARAFIDAELTHKANLANIVMSNADSFKDPAVLSTSVENILGSAVKKASKVVDDTWNNLPSGGMSGGKNLTRVIKKELKNITEGGDMAEISSFAMAKLGRLIKDPKTGKVKFVGGTLFNKEKTEASAKAVHQFYSRLGRQRATFARQGGPANKIRIIDDLREAALDDLAEAGLSAPYVEALKLSREFHDKFTTGAVGKILGLSRGDAVSPMQSLKHLIGAGGQKGKEAIQQALRASPDTKADIEEFIKVQFTLAAKDNKFNNINTDAGKRFIKAHDEILSDIFPSLKANLQEAIAKQVDVDDFIGVPQSTQFSPFMREKSSASIFLKANPNEEMARILNSNNVPREKVLSDLVKITKQDVTGRAFKGLQNGFAEEMLNQATRKGGIDGSLILKNVKKFRPALLKSGLFNKEEISRMNNIGDVFEKIAFELKQVPLEGGIINDIPSQFLTTGLRILAVRMLGFAKRTVGVGSSFGTSLQEANIASGAAARFAKALTNDEARQLLIKAVKDRRTMSDLLKGIGKMTPAQQESLFNRLLGKIKNLSASEIGGFVKDKGIETAKNVIRESGVSKPRISPTLTATAAVGEQRQGLLEKDQAVFQELELLLRQ